MIMLLLIMTMIMAGAGHRHTLYISTWMSVGMVVVVLPLKMKIPQEVIVCHLLPYPVQSQKDPATVDRIMRDLDTNGDGQVSFEEFVSLVVGLSIACEQCYKAHLLKTGARK